MNKGFFDIESLDPGECAGSAIIKSDQDAAALREARQTAERLKAEILRELEAGAAPQIILYKALEAIGLLTSDTEFINQSHGRLNAVYADLLQQSLLQDNETAALERLNQLEEDYNAKLCLSAERQLAGYRKIEKALNEIIATVNQLNVQHE